jgi:hypothetical protein
MLNHFTKTFVVGFVSLLGLVTPGYSQRAWDTKPYHQWTIADVVSLLSDSPWAQTAHETEHFSYNVPGVSYAATIRLRSALPIRQALVRQKQLAVNYDRLNSADRARFDGETKTFLQCSDCARYYIVTLVSFTPSGKPRINIPGGGQLPGSHGVDISGPLKGRSLAEVKPYIHLTNDKGERRALVGFVPPDGKGKDAMFVFPRLDDQGKLLITPANRKFHFEIDEQLFKDMAGPLRKFTFEVSKLIRQGEVVF